MGAIFWNGGRTGQAFQKQIGIPAPPSESCYLVWFLVLVQFSIYLFPFSFDPFIIDIWAINFLNLDILENHVILSSIKPGVAISNQQLFNINHNMTVILLSC